MDLLRMSLHLHAELRNACAAPLCCSRAHIGAPLFPAGWHACAECTSRRWLTAPLDSDTILCFCPVLSVLSVAFQQRTLMVSSERECGKVFSACRWMNCAWIST